MRIRIGSGKLNMDSVARDTHARLVGRGDRSFRYVATDSRETDPETLFVAIRGEHTDGNSCIEKLTDVSCFLAQTLPDAFASSDVSAAVVPDSVSALLSWGGAYRHRLFATGHSCRVFAITGSVGKTTQKELLSAVLSVKYSHLFKTEGNYNSLIGLPMTLLSLSEENDAAVLELGMSAEGEISAMSRAASPDVAIITNVGNAHLEKLGSRENICRAKLEIVDGLPKGGLFILNGDDPMLRDRLPELCEYRVRTFGLSENNDFYAKEIRFDHDGTYFDLVKGQQLIEKLYVPGIGNHFVMAALAAAAVADAEGMTGEELRLGLLSYRAVGMRQSIRRVGKMTLIADCYNASPESMAASANVLAELKRQTGALCAVLLGDMLELGEMSPLLHEETGYRMAKCGAEWLCSVGSFGEAYRAGAIRGGMDPSHIRLFDATEPNAAVLAAKHLKAVLGNRGILLIKGSRAMHLEHAVEYLSVPEKGSE